MDFNDWCRNQGLDVSVLSMDMKASLQKRWRAEMNNIPFAEDVGLADVRERVIMSYSDPEMSAHPERTAAIAHAARVAQLDPRDAGLELMRSQRYQGPATFQRSGPAAMQADVMLASLCGTLGMSGDQLAATGTDSRIVDAAMHREHRGATLHSLFRAKLAAHGERPPNRFADTDIKRVFQLDAQMGPGISTGVDVSGILSNTAHKLALASFAAVGTTWQRFCKVADLANFKEHTFYRLTGPGQLELVAPGGEIKHGVMTESSFTLSANTYAKLIGLDRRDLINDDMQMLQTVPALFGRKGAILVERTVYTLLLANTGDFFHANNANLATGAGSALGVTGLTAAEKLFMQQLDDDGDPTMIPPQLILVPPALSTLARQLVADVTAIAPSGSALLPASNPYAGRFEILESAYLAESTALHANADNDQWYLLTGPGDYAIIVVGFLNGVVAPTIERAEFDFDRLGLSMRAYLDVGANYLEPAGGVQNNGD